MKIWVALLILAISIQPLQAGSCDMDQEQDTHIQATGHPASHMSQADGGHDGADKPGHDCCDPQRTGDPSGCQDMVNCGSCLATAVPSATRALASTPAAWPPAGGTAALALDHSSPPYHPPIP
jgi:hypothetical protein